MVFPFPANPYDTQGYSWTVHHLLKLLCIYNILLKMYIIFKMYYIGLALVKMLSNE